MKKKFESNVAADMPKTKLREPELPWKVTSDDITKAAPKDEEYRSIVAGAPPFNTRAVFMIALVAGLFLLTSIMIIGEASDNEKIRQGMLKREGELAFLKAGLQKLAVEKEALAKNSAQLEKKVNDLSAQKELFTSVIESLTKKSDEAEVDKKDTN